jgi:hypothetical protein
MGLSESTIKLINEPINNLIGTCGHSDCKSKCGEHCFEIEIDTTHPILDALPVLQHKDNSRESHDIILSNVTLIVEREEEKKVNK